MGEERNEIPVEMDIDTSNPYNSCQRVLVEGLNLHVLSASPSLGMCSRSTRIAAMPVMIMVIGLT